MNAVLNTVYPSVEELQALVRNAEEFEKYAKKKAFNEQMGNGQWVEDGKYFRFTMADGSYVKIKLYDCVKKIYNSKNTEVPGRESFLSYIEWTVAPVGMKMYSFLSESKQVIWAYTKGKPPAKDVHATNIASLKFKAISVGIALNDDSFDDTFVRHFQQRN